MVKVSVEDTVKVEEQPVTIGVCPGSLPGDPIQLQMQLPDGSVRTYPQSDQGRVLFMKDVKEFGIAVKSGDSNMPADPNTQRDLLHQKVMRDTALMGTESSGTVINERLKAINDQVAMLELQEQEIQEISYYGTHGSKMPDPEKSQKIDLFNYEEDSGDDDDKKVYYELHEFKYPGGGYRCIEAGMYRPEDLASKKFREERLLDEFVRNMDAPDAPDVAHESALPADKAESD